MNCRFLCSVNQKGKLYCTRTGYDIKDISAEILKDCSKFIDRNYIRHDILESKY